MIRWLYGTRVVLLPMLVSDATLHREQSMCRYTDPQQHW